LRTTLDLGLYAYGAYVIQVARSARVPLMAALAEHHRRAGARKPPVDGAACDLRETDLPKALRPHPHAIYSRRMDHTQILVLALANTPTMITVLIGIVINNARTSDLNSRMTLMESCLTNLDHKFDTRFDLLLSKVLEIDNG
jgi:hypothetical protein